MAFKQVFYALREVFPQIDLRILKAVASQYSSDVDAAVEFVLSDVLPAVSEPIEAHYTLSDINYTEHGHTDSEKPQLYYGGVSLADQGDSDEANVQLNPSSESNPSPGYAKPFCSDNKMEERSQIEDKVVINETMSTPIVDCAELGSSSISATEPLMIGYEYSTPRAFFDHCEAKKEEMASTKNNGNQNHLNSNLELSDLFASSGSTSPLFRHSPLDCAVTYEGQMPLKLCKTDSMHESSKSEDNFSKFVNFCSTDDRQTSRNLRSTPTESEDSYDLQVLLEKQMPTKISKAENTHDFSKSEDDYNLETYFVSFHSTEGGNTSENLLSAPSAHKPSKLEDKYNSQSLFESVDSPEKEQNEIHAAENTPELRKSQNDSFYNLFGKPCIVDSTTQVPRFLGKDENAHSFYKLDGQFNLFDLVASSKTINSSLHIFEEWDHSHIVDSEKQPSIDFKSSENITSTCDLNDDINLLEQLYSTQNVSLSNLASKCELRDETEREILCSNTVDQHSICPVVEHYIDTLPPNGEKMMPSTSKCEELLDTSTHSYQLAEINKSISDFTKIKEELSSLHDTITTRMKEVNLQEEKSAQAKQDAVKAHQDYLAMIENFNHLIERSKESNNKKSQIVREEKSLLAAIAQDLQSRLTKLSAQRDETLTIVDEIKTELHSRLATSLEEEVAAKEQIIQEEKLILLVRKEKEATMESIMEESRTLQKEADGNILLRGLLLDRGRIIDTLQGEISSIHANVVGQKKRTCGGKLELVRSEAPFGNEKPQEEIVGSHASGYAASSDDEWEVLETNQA